MWSAERGKKEKCIPVLRELVEWHGALTFLLILRLTLSPHSTTSRHFHYSVCVCARLALVLILLHHQQPAHTRLLSDWDWLRRRRRRQQHPNRSGTDSFIKRKDGLQLSVANRANGKSWSFNCMFDSLPAWYVQSLYQGHIQAPSIK